ncbi:MAG: hypothetical protein M0P14_00765 [Alkaliphilus sp.]|nr:hypothetical protein [Alkaliphilus sp.]
MTVYPDFDRIKEYGDLRMSLSKDQLQDIIENLQGTCLTLDDVLDDYGLSSEDLNLEDLSRIEEEIFLCDGCGWWYESSELGDDEDGEFLCRWCIECENDMDEELEE